MHHPANDSTPVRELSRFLKCLFAFAVLLIPLLTGIQNASGWSSYAFFDTNKTPLGTHERLNYLAYDRLGQHPLLDPESVNPMGQRIVDFPSLDEIQNFSTCAKNIINNDG